mgnify:CR=1 FL=1
MRARPPSRATAGSICGATTSTTPWTSPRRFRPRDALSAGRYHYSAILDDGTVVSWGDNNFGQTKAPSLDGTVTSVSAGYYSSYAITEDGSVKAGALTAT